MSKKAKLKWRTRKSVLRAGPFSIERADNGVYLKFDGGFCNGAMTFATAEFAEAYAEALLANALKAVKP